MTWTSLYDSMICGTYVLMTIVLTRMCLDKQLKSLRFAVLEAAIGSVSLVIAVILWMWIPGQPVEEVTLVLLVRRYLVPAVIAVTFYDSTRRLTKAYKLLKSMPVGRSSMADLWKLLSEIGDTEGDERS